MNQLTLETRHPEPQNILVERIPVEEKKLPKSAYPFTQSDLMGLTWIFSKEDW